MMLAAFLQSKHFLFWPQWFSFSPLYRLQLMIMLNRLKLLQRFASWTPKHGIQWRLNSGFVEIIAYPEKNERGTIQILADETTFKELTTFDAMRSFHFKFPKDFDIQSSVTSFLLKQDTPMSIEVVSTNNGDVSYLNNIAKNPQTSILMRGIQNKKGVYRLANYEEMSLGEAKSMLTIFYLKLQAEYFCKINNHSAKTELTPVLREEIINYLCYRNETNDQQLIAFLQNERLQHLSYVSLTVAQVQSIETKADRFLRWYQLGAIGITGLHIVSFGYMIFFVDWLGWDIIQPLTFSVSCIYLLIGLRFYRKFRKDRTLQSIRDRFRHLVLSPKQMMRLQELKFKLAQRKQHLKETDLKIKIARNRLSQTSTIISTFNS